VLNNIPEEQNFRTLAGKIKLELEYIVLSPKLSERKRGSIL
jgi:hypothetical protein